jgi:hypothetical protein
MAPSSTSRQKTGSPRQAPSLPPAPGHAPTAPPSATTERWLAWVVLALILLALAIRVPLLFNAGLAEDETEHLHAAWAVAHGQVPYRDFWQPHTPLFYYLMAPVFALLGEDLRIVYVARGLMLLCLLLTLLQLYRIAKRCFDGLTGLLAILLLSYLWLWWTASYDIRPDIPQTLLILVSLSYFMRAWEGRRRGEFLAAGALMGIAWWLLLKTLFPLAGLIGLFGVSAGLRRSAAATRESLTNVALFLTGFAIPMALGAILLWGAGAWPAFVRWVLIGSFRSPERFSALSKMDAGVHSAFFALALVGAGLTVARMLRARAVDEVRLAPLLAGTVTAAVYLFLMPAPYSQSALPFLPLAAMYAADVVRRILARALAPGTPGEPVVPLGASRRRLAWAALAALLLAGACVPPLRTLLRTMPPLHDQWADGRALIRHVLAITSPGDSIFDVYRYYLFRPHATYYYRLADVILMWLQSGYIPESKIINDLVRTHCKVVIFSRPLRRLPPNLFAYLRSHYVPTRIQDRRQSVLVAGTVIHRGDLTGNRTTLSLVASAEYAIRVTGGIPNVSIDGKAYQASLFLAQGSHEIVVEGTFESLTIFYSRVLAIPDA